MTRILQFMSQEVTGADSVMDVYPDRELDAVDRAFLHSFLRDNLEKM